MKRLLIVIGVCLIPSVLNCAGFENVTIQHWPFPAGTNYLPGSGYLAHGSATEAQVAIPYHTAGVMSGLYVFIITNDLSGSSTLTLRKNGVDTAMKVTIGAGASGKFEDVVDSITISPGDTIDYKFVTTGTGVGADLNTISTRFDATNNSMLKYTLTIADGFVEGNWFPTFYMFPKWILDYSNQSDVQNFVINHAGSFANLSTYVTGNTNTGNTHIHLFKNHANSSLDISVPGSTNGLFEDLTHSVSVVSGDTVTVTIAADTPQSGGFGPTFISMEFTSTDKTVEYFNGSVPKTISAGQTNGSGVESTSGVDGASFQIPLRSAATFSKLRLLISANTLNVSSTWTLLKNGSPTSLGITIPSGNTGFLEDNLDTVNFSSSDYTYYQISAPAGSGSITWQWAAVTVQNTDALNSIGFYASDSEKIPRDCFYPHCVSYASSTISRVWDGHTITPFSAQDQVASFEAVMTNNSGADASSVTVTMSDLSCPSGNTIHSVVVSSLNVVDTSQRPIQVFSAWYVQNLGVSIFPYGHNEYEERIYPLDMRVPYTIDGNGRGIPNGTILFTNRTYHDMYLPAAWVPEEEFLASSETIKTGNSKSWWVDMYISTSIPAGICTGTFSIYAGATLSTSAPVSLLVYGAKLPVQTGFTEIAWLGNGDTNDRINGNSSPSQPYTGNYLTAINNMAKLFKAHNIIPGSDHPDINTNDFPSTQGVKQLDGTLYTSANGFGNSRGVAQPDQFYWIGGAYSGWQNNPNFSQTNATLFCNQVSSWSIGMSAYPNAKLGLYGQDEVSDQTTNEKWATWLETSCVQSGSKIHMFVTDSLPHAAVNTPHTAYPTSANIWTSNTGSSTQTWQTYANSYEASASSMVGRYNDILFGGSANNILEESGETPEANYWGLWKKLCPLGVCHGYHFEWEGNYWTDTNNGGQPDGNRNNVYNVAKTFGYDIYPTTSAQWGHYGGVNNYAQGDGVWAFPGRDLYAWSNNVSFGFLGGVATWSMKEVRRGVDDVDLLNMAYAVNPSSTTALVQEVFSKALWEVPCQADNDCTYAWTDRTWSYGADAWTRARERVMQIITSAPQGQSSSLKGSSVWKGKGILQ